MLCAAALVCLVFFGGPPAERPGRGPEVGIIVLDGLRPDSIQPDITPNLYRLQHQGLSFPHSQAVFPTVTRVNAASLVTGTYPERHGLVANMMYLPELEPHRAVSTARLEVLEALRRSQSGRLLLVRSLAEVLADHGKTLRVVSSGSAGTSLLLAPEAKAGHGGVIAAAFVGEAGVLAFPAALHATVLDTYGTPPTDETALLAWHHRTLLDHQQVLLPADVMVYWLTEPDATQHQEGLGAPTAQAMLQRVDAFVGEAVAQWSASSRFRGVVVLSDHGFSTSTFGVNVGDAMGEAGLGEASRDGSIVLAGNTHARFAYVKPAWQERFALFLQNLPGHERLYASQPRAGFLDMATLQLGARAPDFLWTFHSDSLPNAFGIVGRVVGEVFSEPTGPVSPRYGHGGLNRWHRHQVMFLFGPDVEAGQSNRRVGTVDVAPTVLDMLGLPIEASMQGRSLRRSSVYGSRDEIPLGE